MFVSIDDVRSFAGDLSEADLMLLVDGANARAMRLAPCLATASAEHAAEAKLILVGVVRRWIEAGSGARQTEQAGIFSYTLDTRQRQGGYTLWPSEVTELQSICGESSPTGAFTVDMTGGADADPLAMRPDLWFQWQHPYDPTGL